MKKASIILGILLLVVLLILFVPAYFGLTLRNRAVDHAAGEIRMLSSALETYKSDRGHYPTDPATTEQLQPNGTYDPVAYDASAAFLYRELSGLEDKSRKNYLSGFKGSKLRTDKNGVTRVVDPWGNSYGYSTFKATHPESGGGNNPTFDLWSTGDDTGKSDPTKWMKNW